jgi:hypothetical protein
MRRHSCKGQRGWGGRSPCRRADRVKYARPSVRPPPAVSLGSSGSRGGINSVQPTPGPPPIPTVGGATGDRRRDRPKTDRGAALQRNVEAGQQEKYATRDMPLSVPRRAASRAVRRPRSTENPRRWTAHLRPADKDRRPDVSGQSAPHETGRAVHPAAARSRS